jgi:hypothetical protein
MKLKNIATAALIAVTAAAFIIGSVDISDAKGKKKAAAAPPPQPAPCMEDGKKVCGVKGGLKFTYANTCYAAKDGVSSVSPGPCKVAKAKKAKKGGAKKAKKAAKKK